MFKLFSNYKVVVLLPLSSALTFTSLFTSISTCDPSIVANVEKFHGQTIIIKNKELFEEKKKRMISAGPSRLQIISDFDYTLTKYWLKGRKGLSCHGVIETMMPEEYQDETHKLMSIYYPIEVSSTIDLATKSQYMVDWTVKTHDVLVKR